MTIEALDASAKAVLDLTGIEAALRTTPAACAVAFSASAVVDLFMAKWVAAVAQKRALRAAVLSMACAGCLLAGITETLSHGYWVRACWVLGYGIGSYVAVKTGGAH